MTEDLVYGQTTVDGTKDPPLVVAFENMPSVDVDGGYERISAVACRKDGVSFVDIIRKGAGSVEAFVRGHVESVCYVMLGVGSSDKYVSIAVKLSPKTSKLWLGDNF